MTDREKAIEKAYADLECQRDFAYAQLAELHHMMEVMREFFDLTTIEVTDNDIEVVFWNDTNYEYAKELLKKIKSMLKDKGKYESTKKV